MNDHDTPLPPEDESHESTEAAASSGDEHERLEDGQPTTPPGMLPLVEPFFEKRAFLIAAMPFLIYFLGTALGGHFEMSRKTQPAHDIRGISRSLLDSFTAAMNSEMLEEDVQALSARYDLDQVANALDDESSKVKVLVEKCQKLLDGGSFESEPQGVRESLVRLRTFVEHFLELHIFWEDDELNKIRPAYIKFAEENLPGEQLNLNDSWYPATYTIACLAALIGVLFALPVYLKKVPFRISPFAVTVGVVGVVLWVGIWWLNKHYGPGHAGSRAAFNPFVELADNPAWMWTFLGIRLLGMVIVIPIAEEFFLRGFLMRYCEDVDWDQIPIGEATWRGWAGILAYACLSHTETAAALVWFGMITWMYLKTKNIWDCVVAHSVTNGLLAVFVLATGTWALW